LGNEVKGKNVGQPSPLRINDQAWGCVGQVNLAIPSYGWEEQPSPVGFLVTDLQINRFFYLTDEPLVWLEMFIYNYAYGL